MTGKLAGKTALITGASSGIGRASAEARVLELAVLSRMLFGQSSEKAGPGSPGTRLVMTARGMSGPARRR